MIVRLVERATDELDDDLAAATRARLASATRSAARGLAGVVGQGVSA